MTKHAFDYAGQLHALKVPRGAVQDTAIILRDVPAVKNQLCDPTVPLEKKLLDIDRIFPVEMRDFLKLLCDNDRFGEIDDIIAAYHKDDAPDDDAFRAELIYVTAPSEEQVEKIKSFLRRKYQRAKIELTLKEDATLASGFKLRAGADEYDWSAQGRMEQLREHLSRVVKQGSGQGIISILKSSVKDFELKAKYCEVGVVKYVGDGIATIDGIDHAMYGEIVQFDTGDKGMVQDIRRDEIGCILFSGGSEVCQGTRVMRTGKMAGIPVGKAFLGRIVNALGAPIDGAGEIAATDYRPIENPAPSIIDRQSVSVPMETGILAIDSMFPIGRGQRELIIGDRQTGKTSVALDAILNQRGKDIVCIYVAIGQKSSTVAKIVNTLKKNHALDYTIIVSATASDPAPLQYIAPYSGTALGEYFMHEGKDVLIIYDDLSKHAVAYRALSLLLERSPGREAYPGDVFYLHSRLLERSARLKKELGGGSITALPIIETQAGDLSAYIPTNVISITDGQIFLESDLFFAGQRPAVNVGLSVSRVGGAAQTKAMKKAAGTIRIDLAQYREMEVFTQFSSDLDDATKQQLAYGAGLMELLKQPLYQPLSMAEQVCLLVTATAKVMVPVKKSDIRSFRSSLLDYFHDEYSSILQELESGRVLTDDLRERIVAAAREFRDQHFRQTH